MEHLFGISAYQFDLDEHGGTAEAIRKIMGAGADGIELLTGYFVPDPIFRGIAKGVHLPYATDWYSAWAGDTGYIDIVSDENVKYRSYGRCREEMMRTLRDSIVCASSLSPAYGVFHASNTRMDEVMGFDHRDSDEDVVHAVAELLNGTMGLFPGGEPPFRVLLENLWWPGLTMTDDSGFRMLCDRLEFDNWGLCLDTGHLMNRLGNCSDERKSIDDVMRIVKKYPPEMMDRIDVVHLHMSLSAGYTEECRRNPVEFVLTDDDEMISKAYGHVCMVDQHRPFTDASCTDIVRTLMPRYVTHEISSPSPSERLTGFAGQRSLFPK
ncbi:MAG: sugar phosphate isomerase/epimerase [Methanomassiliicoccaceae archaeon]|jgi:sugar phosphate isomerase/epimerase|nr:sugar phosphate isomerase/epimerase [Methanomassiliicoccaceae archaeon]